MDFSKKYKKYKNKFLELKNLVQSGGAKIGDRVYDRYSGAKQGVIIEDLGDKFKTKFYTLKKTDEDVTWETQIKKEEREQKVHIEKQKIADFYKKEDEYERELVKEQEKLQSYAEVAKLNAISNSDAEKPLTGNNIYQIHWVDSSVGVSPYAPPLANYIFEHDKEGLFSIYVVARDQREAFDFLQRDEIMRLLERTESSTLKYWKDINYLVFAFIGRSNIGSPRILSTEYKSKPSKPFFEL